MVVCCHKKNVQSYGSSFWVRLRTFWMTLTCIYRYIIVSVHITTEMSSEERHQEVTGFYTHNSCRWHGMMWCAITVNSLDKAILVLCDLLVEAERQTNKTKQKNKRTSKQLEAVDNSWQQSLFHRKENQKKRSNVRRKYSFWKKVEKEREREKNVTFVFDCLILW